ncbi:MAG: IS5 family transposase, partial [Candidatus Methylomirabilis sp.]|nr:IS5 family transposase [Deltaproteobacteria bacterium]
MRGDDRRTGSLFSYVDLESRAPRVHPLRTIREIVDEVLAELSPEFSALYARTGRPSIPPERLLRALLLQAFYTIRSERRLMEQLDFNLLFRWFVGLGIDDGVWDATVFCKNRDRLPATETARRLLSGVLRHRRVRRLLSGERFSVDGTLVEAWASMKSFRPKDEEEGPKGGGGRNAARDWRGEKRSNRTHASRTDPDARLYRKGRATTSQLCYAASVLMENRSGLAVDAEVRRATGRAEWEAAVEMVGRRRGRRRITVGGDRNYDMRPVVSSLRALGATPHAARHAYETARARRRSAIDGRTTRHPGYEASLRVRKRIE